MSDLETLDHHDLLMDECIAYRRETLAFKLRQELRVAATTLEESPGLAVDYEQRMATAFNGCCTCPECAAYRREHGISAPTKYCGRCARDGFGLEIVTDGECRNGHVASRSPQTDRL